MRIKKGYERIHGERVGGIGSCKSVLSLLACACNKQRLYSIVQCVLVDLIAMNYEISELRFSIN